VKAPGGALRTPRDTILVELLRSPVELPEVIASASPTKPLRYAGTTKYDEVFLRQKVGLGTLIPRSAIEGRLGASTYELLQGIPAAAVLGRPPYRGLSFDEEPVVEMLSRVNPSDIEMIEVFRGPSEIPGVFHWNGCAAIAVWTRWNK